MTNPTAEDRLGSALAGLVTLVARLRAPDGCPWDQKQTAQSVAPYILEEAFEAVEAVEAGSPEEVRGELGDVLFQVVFMAQLFEEAGHFSLEQVIAQVVAKMTSRHPHVFGELSVASAEEVKELWGKIKKAERAGRDEGLLDSVPKAAPALVRARRLGQRAARVGFDWPGADAVWKTVDQEMDELAQAQGETQAEAELGDVLFTWAQWARHRGLDPEACLRQANARFQQRFSQMERLAKQRGLDLEAMSLAEQDSLWKEAKALLKA